MTKTVVKSVRIDPELWAYVQGRALKREIKPNAWVVRMIEMVRDGKLREVKS